MAGPKRQHFIPKSYLRNFANIQGEKAFVEAMNMNTGKIISNNIHSPKNILKKLSDNQYMLNLSQE